jgi:hypothetical protein
MMTGLTPIELPAANGRNDACHTISSRGVKKYFQIYYTKG